MNGVTIYEVSSYLRLHRKEFHVEKLDIYEQKYVYFSLHYEPEEYTLACVQNMKNI